MDLKFGSDRTAGDKTLETVTICFVFILNVHLGTYGEGKFKESCAPDDLVCLSVILKQFTVS